MKPVSLLVLLTGLLLFFSCKPSPDKIIKDAITSRYKDKHGAINQVEFSMLSFRSVSSSYPDSMRLLSMRKKIDHYQKQYDFWANIGTSALEINISNKMMGASSRDSKSIYDNAVFTRELYFDSLNTAIKKATEMKQLLEARVNKDRSFTKADYIVKVTTDREQFTDTASVILNDSMRIVLALD